MKPEFKVYTSTFQERQKQRALKDAADYILKNPNKYLKTGKQRSKFYKKYKDI